jgi:hypothetical protein
MVSYEFPYIVEIFLTSLGIIGTLLVAYAIVEQAKGDKNSGRVFLVIFGMALILIGFFLKLWYGIYVKYGEISFIYTMALTAIPLFGYAMAGTKSTLRAIITLIILYAVITAVILTLYFMKVDLTNL